MKVLFIEDDQSIQDTMELVFKFTMSDVELLPALGGLDGIDMVRNTRPDIIILDLGLPDISGYEVLKNIRENESIPIVILTARSEPDTRDRCRELGADDFITKPFRRSDIVNAINNLVVQNKEGSEKTAC